MKSPISIYIKPLLFFFLVCGKSPLYASEKLYCHCGEKLEAIGLDLLPDYGSTVMCDDPKCTKIIPEDEWFFHCPRGKNTVHPDGYYLCSACFVENKPKIRCVYCEGELTELDETSSKKEVVTPCNACGKKIDGKFWICDSENNGQHPVGFLLCSDCHDDMPRRIAIKKNIRINNVQALDKLINVDNVNTPYGSAGHTPLHLAIRNKNISAFNCIWEYCPNIHAVTLYKQTVLHLAGLVQFPKIIGICFYNGAILNKKDIMGCCPLVYAIYKGNEEAVNLFIDYGCNLFNCFKIDKEQYTLISYAKVKNENKILLALKTATRNCIPTITERMTNKFNHILNFYVRDYRKNSTVNRWIPEFNTIIIKYYELSVLEEYLHDSSSSKKKIEPGPLILGWIEEYFREKEELQREKFIKIEKNRFFL